MYYILIYGGFGVPMSANIGKSGQDEEHYIYTYLYNPNSNLFGGDFLLGLITKLTWETTHLVLGSRCTLQHIHCTSFSRESNELKTL